MPRAELVVLMGLQASGKSSFARLEFAGSHVVVSKDDWPNARRKQQRMMRTTREYLSAGSSVVIDNTNVSAGDRRPLVDLGREFDARVVGYWLESDVDACAERNASRVGRARVPDVGFFATVRRLEWPSMDEGFDELHSVRMIDADRFEIAAWEERRRG